MLAPVGLILLALVPPSGKVSVRFLQEILFGTIGAGPLFLTMLGVAAFYAWAILRRVSYAVEALSAVLLMFSVVGPKTVDEATIHIPPQAFPILAIGLIQVLLAWRRPSAPAGLRPRAAPWSVQRWSSARPPSWHTMGPSPRT